MIWLTKEQLIFLHSDLINTSGGLDDVRDEGMIESAIAAPFITFDSKEMFPSVIEKATRLAYGLVQNHPFIDGNKRIGAHALLVCLALNNIYLEYEQSELAATFLKLAAGNSSYQELLIWVTEHIMKTN